MSAHPLDPLTPEELARAVEVVRRDCDLGSRVRFIRVDLEEPAKPELASESPPSAAASARRHPRQRRQGELRGDHRPGERRRRALDAAGRCPAGDLGRRVRRGRRGGAGRSATTARPWPAAGSPAMPSTRCTSSRGRSARSRPRTGDSPARSPGCARPTTTSTRTPARWAAGCGRRSERDDGRPRRRPRRRADPAGERGLPRRCGRAVSRRPEAAGDHAAGRPQLRARRPRAALAEVADAGRVRTRARASCCTRSRYDDDGERRPSATARRSPSWSFPYGDPSPTMHFKNVFDIGEYGLGPLTNSLELGCDCLGEIRYLDASFVDTKGERAGAAKRDLHPRGGLRHPLEAPRRPHRPRTTSPGRAAWWCPRSRPSATTSTASTGTSTRTARSSSR